MALNTDNELVDKEALNAIGKLVQNRAKSLSPSSRVANAIEMEIAPPTKTGQNAIKLTVNMIKHAVPFARAMEYGSGIWARGRVKSPHQATMGGKIRIEPKNPDGVLAFPWQKANVNALKANLRKRISEAKSVGLSAAYARKDGNKFYGEAPDGNLMFNYVDHPGILAANKGAGYMRLALKQTIEEIKGMVGANGAKNLKLKVRAKFTRSGGHT
jgi:hypothetical protein